MAASTLRLVADYVAPMDEAVTVHSPGFVDVAGGLVVACGRLADAPTLPDGSSIEHVGGLLMPGMINGHAHSSMTVLRGTGEGLPLDRWLKEVIWPRETRLDPEDVETGMALGSAEMLRNGVTTTNEMYFFPESVAAGARRAGMRAVVGVAIIEGLDRFGTPDQQLDSGLALWESSRGDPLIDYSFGPHSAYALGDDTLRRIGSEAAARDMLVHIHVAESKHEGDGVTERTGKTVPEHLADLGVLDARVMAAHCVWVTPSDIRLLSEHRVGIAHCPGSNGKIASGIAPIVDIRKAGIPISISTDGPASNDDLDVLDEARLALLYSRLREQDAAALGVAEALGMVTREAAAALGRPDLGTLEPGSAADIIRIDLDRPEYEPVREPFDVLNLLVWAGSARDVTDVWVGGERTISAGEPLKVDLQAVRAEIGAIAARISV